MMLHRHFEAEKPDRNLTKLADLNQTKPEEFVSEVFPPDVEDKKEDAPAKRGRKKKTDTE